MALGLADRKAGTVLLPLPSLAKTLHGGPRVVAKAAFRNGCVDTQDQGSFSVLLSLPLIMETLPGVLDILYCFRMRCATVTAECLAVLLFW